MGQGSDRGPIVVGVDGSDGSHGALGWAVEEAALRGTSLEVIHAYGLPHNVAHLMSAQLVDGVLEETARAARDLVGSMIAGIDDVEVTAHAIESINPAEPLVERSSRAALLVVGSRGHGSFRSLLLGSVSQQCAQHAECPVVIVR